MVVMRAPQFVASQSKVSVDLGVPKFAAGAWSLGHTWHPGGLSP